MREIQSSEAKTHLPQILDEVERGETIIITRHGRRIARIVPEASNQAAEVGKTFEQIRSLARTVQDLTMEDILSARHEGHRY
jgi:prevent-host-death family protein